MCDSSLPEIGDLAGLNAAELVAAAGGWARAENAACARKLAVMAEIFARRTGLPADERELWWIDPEAAVSAELAAAQNISGGMALNQTHRGVALRDRLPEVAALFEAGLISDSLVRAIVWRTDLIISDEAMAAVDAELARQVKSWGALSVAKTEVAIDALVDKHDPGALRRARESYRGRGVQFGSAHDEPGVTSMWGRLYAPDAAAVQQRVEEMARSVCEGDPRTLAERRADALGALAAGTELACTCGQDDCDAAHREVPTNAVVYVIANQDTVDAAHDNDHPSGDDAPPPRDPHECPTPAYVFGAGVLSGALMGPIVDRSKLQSIFHPGDGSAEPRYTPSAKLAEFVRCRDLTCRFPGCDRPATTCDIDHTVPYPHGPTHASNLKCLCRFHHLLKTFWGGWADRQLPDGTVIWTSPTGHTYTTHPGSRTLFPSLSAPTATLWDAEPPTVEKHPDRGTMMPKRRNSRAHNSAKAIAAERRLNDPHVAERNKPPPF